MNIVIKLVAVKITESWPFYCSTCKISEGHGKYSGDKATVNRFLETLYLKKTKNELSKQSQWLHDVQIIHSAPNCRIHNLCR